LKTSTVNVTVKAKLHLIYLVKKFWSRKNASTLVRDLISICG